MASVPNRVYPMSEYNEINTLKLNTTDVVATGKLSGSDAVITGKISGNDVVASGKVSGSHLFATAFTQPQSYTGSASPGEIFIITGSDLSICAICVKIKSGSSTAIYSGSSISYISTG